MNLLVDILSQYRIIHEHCALLKYKIICIHILVFNLITFTGQHPNIHIIICTLPGTIVTALRYYLKIARLLRNKYFKEPSRAKAKKLGAQLVMCWELLQKI